MNALKTIEKSKMCRINYQYDMIFNWNVIFYMTTETLFLYVTMFIVKIKQKQEIYLYVHHKSYCTLYYLYYKNIHKLLN